MNRQMYITYTVAAAVGLCVAGWFGFNWYRTQRAEHAQVIVSQCFDEYHKTLTDQHTSWQEMQFMAELAQQQVGNAGISPFVLVIQAQAHAHNGEVEQALSLMDTAIERIGDNQAYGNWFRLTRALMQFDAQDTTMREQALTGLQALADDQENIYRDAALYYCALYYWIHDDRAQAQRIWETLVAQADQLAESPWVERASQYLETV